MKVMITNNVRNRQQIHEYEELKKIKVKKNQQIQIEG